MQDRDKSILIVGIILSLFGVILSLPLNTNDVVAPQVINTCNEDSLKSEIYRLESEIKSEEEGWDSKERRYEDVLFEYEYGINHLKESHPEAYREFHRIIGYKEHYNRDTERDNKKRLKIDSF